MEPNGMRGELREEPSGVGAAVVLEAWERKKLRVDPKLASRWW